MLCISNLGPMNRGEIESFGNLELLAKNLVQGFITGLHKSPFRGFSVEFAEHRQYNKGESTKHLDWKLYARTDRLYVKEYEEETNLRANIILDCSPSMYYPEQGSQPSKIEFACYAAAVLMELLNRQRDAFGLSLYDEEILYKSELKSTPAHKEHLFSVLDKVLTGITKGQGKSDIVQVLHQQAETLPKRSMVIVFSDFLLNGDYDEEELWEAFRHLAHQNHDIIVYQISDKETEQALQFGNREFRFEDVESGQILKANPQELQKAYQEKMKNFFFRLETQLKSSRVDLCFIDIQEDMNRVIRSFLSRRKKNIQSKRT